MKSLAFVSFIVPILLHTPGVAVSANQPDAQPDAQSEAQSDAQHDPVRHPEDNALPNRLINETSPYLLQHAHNPVDWHPWGEEAFAEARRRDVPIFLSIGYSTCYWCHVMERESFEDGATAAVMNERFVCIKVDREERPDVDDVYMAATQLMTGSGGWPMNTFLDPHTLKPFWCGTYFPPEPMHGRPSFTQVMMGMSDVWVNKRGEATEQADNLAAAVRDHLAGDAEPAALGAEQVGAAVTTLLQIFDRTEGGFGGAPKFPQPVYARFLLDARPIVDEETRAAIDHAVRLTLDRMAVGGLFDQVGGGFHRYCVDGTWTVPHFEKMLYDNAQLLPLYARASDLYGDAFYREIAERTFAYLQREMTGPRGGFYSAQDAEVDGREGLNYLWTAEQIGAVLVGEDAAFANAVYGVTDGTNFRDPHHPEDEPSNVLRLEGRPGVVAERLGMSMEAFSEARVRVDAALLAARDKRTQPGLDDKVLSAWNGMMIVGLAEAAEALDDRSMLDAAERAGEFLVGTMRAADGRLHRSFRATDKDAAGRARHDGVLEDHAWAVLALLALDDAGRTGGADGAGFRAVAVEIAGAIHRDFADGTGFYTDVAGGRDDLFVRPRSTYDGATPSGTGVAIDALLALGRADPSGPWADRAVEQLEGVSRDVAERPVSAVNAVRSVITVLAMDGGADRLAFGDVVPPADSRVDATSSASVVEIFADQESITLAGDEPETLTLGFRIKPGYHILAADPVAPGGDEDDGLIPLRVGLVSGGGVAVYAEYPEGDPYGASIVGSDNLRVHSGELRLRVVIERQEGVGAGPGKPVLGVTFQACDDAACLKPATVRIGVRIDIE